MLLATIASVIFGICLPFALIIFGDTVDSFNDRAAHLCSLNLSSLTEKFCPSNVTLTTINFYSTISYNLSDHTKHSVKMLLVIGCVNLISGYIRVLLLEITAERQTRTIRKILFQSILSKDLFFFDTYKTGQLILHLTDDTHKIQDGIGNKFGSAIEMVTTLSVVLLLIFICISYDISSLAQASPFFQALYEARVAAYGIWQIIDQSSEINADFDQGLTKYDLMGDIQFSNVYFFYPARSNVPILTNLSLKIKYGQTVALVGSSGSGKSTYVQLLQQFYNPQSVSICIDGTETKEYNLKWLREHIGVVNQEPVLFHKTIRENILFGFDLGTNEQIHQAAKMANAHDFIMALPNKYETLVGERGAALSGGQKQKIAMARALLRDPRILLLDEATSSLDNESEKIVHEALERASQNRTTLVIAHRLSTIRRADKSIVMQKGEIVEEGDHESLMNTQGLYFNLAKQQNLRQIEEVESKLEDKDMNKLMITDQPNDISIDDSYYLLVFQQCDKNVQKRKVLFYVLLYVGFGVISLVLHSVQGYVFARSGETLTKRLRSKAFQAILRQDMTFFDREENSTGALCTRLATEASAVQVVYDLV
ncbi:unnamed protein product [Rotaria socialis]|uniref:Uncharacterized protein n=1 Tax=Rotaria socialis TaxID=392032 RepID=A0A817ZGR1_9BILA|nr:unnamed protein product [Rotaria socialis]